MKPVADSSQKSRLNSSDYSWLAALILIFALVGFVRLRLVSIPLERDEGEYAYGGQLLLQGIPPYSALYTMKWPGTAAAYAVIMAVSGETPGAIHTGLLIINFCTAILLFLLAKKFFDTRAAGAAAATFLVLSITVPITGLAAHATHFVTLFAIAGILLIADVNKKTPAARLFSAGFLFGLAALMKQPGLLFAIFAVTWLIGCEWLHQWKNVNRLLVQIAYVVLGVFLPLVIMFAALFHLHVEDRFWFWTVDYARAYGSLVGLQAAANTFRHTATQLIAAAPGLWLAGLVGLILLCFSSQPKRSKLFLSSLFAFSFFAVAVGKMFRGHYFVQILPAIGLCAAAALETLPTISEKWFRKSMAQILSGVLLLIALLLPFTKESPLFFRSDSNEACRRIYRENPFPEAVEIGRFLQTNCPPDARIAVIGSEPEIYFYSKRRSSTGHIYMYPLMEPQPFAQFMQNEMIREIETNPPAYVIFPSAQASWGIGPGSNGMLFEWFKQYQTQLELVGLFEMMDNGQTESRWDFGDAKLVKPRSPNYVAIYKRKEKRGSPGPTQPDSDDQN